MDKKICTKCRTEKLLSDFVKESARPSGFASHCKQCKRQMIYEWRSRNPEKWNSILKRYRATDRAKEKKREWYKTEKGKLFSKTARSRERYKIWRANYERSAKVKAYRAVYKAQAHRKTADRLASKTAHARSIRREYQRRRRLLIQVRIHNAMSCRMRAFISKKQVTWPHALNYTARDLMRHLERQFHNGMTWENFGRSGWHIDHIVPVSAFSFKSLNDPEFRACWSLPNLRPIWARENLSKRAKRTHLL